MSHGTDRSIRGTAAVLAFGMSLVASGCKEEEPIPKLFEEDGVWALINFDAEGDGNAVDVTGNRLDIGGGTAAFMLKFTEAMKVVQTAACVFPGTSADPDPLLNPGNTPCGMFDDDTEWECHCYGYAFEREEMKWVEFTAGDTPPMVSLEDSMPAADGTAMTSSGSGTGGDDDDDDDTGGGGVDGETIITLSEVPSVNFTYHFRPLPDGVWGSNGTTSLYRMQARVNSAFNTVDDDPMRQSCTPCI